MLMISSGGSVSVSNVLVENQTSVTMQININSYPAIAGITCWKLNI